MLTRRGLFGALVGLFVVMPKKAFAQARLFGETKRWVERTPADPVFVHLDAPEGASLLYLPEGWTIGRWLAWRAGRSDGGGILSPAEYMHACATQHPETPAFIKWDRKYVGGTVMADYDELIYLPRGWCREEFYEWRTGKPYIAHDDGVSYNWRTGEILGC